MAHAGENAICITSVLTIKAMLCRVACCFWKLITRLLPPETRWPWKVVAENSWIHRRVLQNTLRWSPGCPWGGSREHVTGTCGNAQWMPYFISRLRKPEVEDSLKFCDGRHAGTNLTFRGLQRMFVFATSLNMEAVLYHCTTMSAHAASRICTCLFWTKSSANSLNVWVAKLQTYFD